MREICLQQTGLRNRGKKSEILPDRLEPDGALDGAQRWDDLTLKEAKLIERDLATVEKKTKGILRRIQSSISDAVDTDYYLVVVFTNRREKKAFLSAIPNQVSIWDNQFIDGLLLADHMKINLPED